MFLSNTNILQTDLFDPEMRRYQVLSLWLSRPGSNGNNGV